MKKTLIALAALAATGAVMAQSSVTIYGVIDQAVTRVSNSDGAASVTQLTSSNNMTNRLGFRGTEDLGGGLKARFQIETGLAADAPAATTLGDRGAWVGLEGSFGFIRLGREYNPSFYVTNSYSPFGTGGVGNNLNFANRVNAHALTGQANTNWNSNAVTYTTPRVAGFMGEIQYAFDEQTAAASGSAGQSTGVRLNFTDGPISAEISHSKTDGGLAITFPANPANNTALQNLQQDLGIASTLDHKSTQVGASYDFGVAKIMANYGQEKGSQNATGAEVAKVTSYEIGVVAPMGPGRIRASYASTKLKVAGDTDPAAKANKFSVGYVYDLSKRTMLYGNIARLSNKNGYNLGLSGTTAATNGSSTGYQVGLTHTF